MDSPYGLIEVADIQDRSVSQMLKRHVPSAKLEIFKPLGEGLGYG